MFFRIKKIKGKEYAYIVENKWRKTAKSVGTSRGIKPQGSRQKVIGYAGKVCRFNLQNNVDFPNYLKIEDIRHYIENNEQKKVIMDLIEWELFKFGINKEEFSIDLKSMEVKAGKKKVALLLNEGFMCTLTLRNLLNFKSVGDEQADGYNLARVFVEAGIKVPQAVFIGIFSKLYKRTDS